MKLKNNKIFRVIIIPLCLCLCFFGQLIPGNNYLSSDAIGVICIFLGSLILWLTIGIDWPSLLCMFSLGFIKSFGFSKVFTSSFGDSTFIFLLFTFICTYALSKTSLIKRIAIFFINNKVAKRSGFWFCNLFLFATLVLGLFISPTVLFVIILPILEEIFTLANINKGDKIAKLLMLGVGFSVSISSGMTPIAHVFPIIAMNVAKINISPFTYMAFAIPTGLIIFILMLIMLWVCIRPETKKLKEVDLSTIKHEITNIDKKDIIVLIIFITVIALWIIPSLFKDLSIDFYNAINQYGVAMPSLLGTILLCIIRIDDKPILKIDEALRNGVSWPSLLMCAATLVLGKALTSDDIGIKLFLQNSMGSSLSGINPTLLLIIFASWAMLQTNLSSNMVTATVVATVASNLVSNLPTLNLNSLICVIGMISSFAFATPPSMPHIAMIASSEYCDTKDTLIYGSMLMLISLIVILCIGYPLGTILM